MDFAVTLKYLRESMGLTQKELAKKSGLSCQCICALEQGKRSPNGNTLIALSRALDISTDYLLGLEDDLGVRTVISVSDSYSLQEREIITKFRALPSNSKNLILKMLDIRDDSGILKHQDLK